MTLVVSLNNSAIWQKLLTQELGTKISNLQQFDAETEMGLQLLVPQITVASLTQLLNQYKNKTILVVYLQAEHALALGIKEQGDLASLAAEWLVQQQHLVELQRQHRGQLKLVNLVSMFNGQSAATLTELGFATVAPLPYEFEPLALLGACHFVATHPEVNALNTLLFASSVPLQDDYRIELNISQVLLQHYNLQRQCSQAKAASTELQHENNRLTARQQEAQQERLSQQSELEKTKAELHNVQEATISLKAENELVLQQLMSVQEELERYYNKQQQLTERLDYQQQRAEKTIAGLEKQFNLKKALIVQKDEKLRTLSQKLKAARLQCDEKSNLTGSLQKQILELTESLELANHQAQQRYSQLETENQSLKKQLEGKRDFELQLKQQKLLINQLSLSEHSLKNQLKSVTGSTIWKAVQPVRRITKLLSKQDKQAVQLQQNIALLLTSEYFDPTWYTQTYPDLAAAKINPAEHYIRYGAAEGRLPSPLFDGNSYLNRYPDVAESGINPLIHFIKFGRSEGRSPAPKLLQYKTKKAGN